jgi:tRNA(Arg) A34 adenosine deaminase TadA
MMMARTPSLKASRRSFLMNPELEPLCGPSTRRRSQTNFRSMPTTTTPPVVHIEYPGWVNELVDWDYVYKSDDEKMRLAIAVSRENVLRGTGGPFGAAIFQAGPGPVVAVGMNSVVRLNNCTLHGEMVAFMMAQQRIGSFTLNAPALPAHELFTSCEPCAMCLGATLWSGVRRVVCGAGRDDASRLKFEEGPVFPESYKYLEDRGITVERNVLRDEARAVLELYRANSGKIYNG